MIANIQFDNIEEMQEFAKLISGGCNCNGKVINIQAPVVTTAETPKEELKETKKKTTKKADKKEESKEEKKEETPKVEAEVAGVDECVNNEPVQDIEPKEDEEPKVTKEMVREICSRAIKAGKPGEVKKIVANHGASKIPELKEEEFAAVYKEVEALL